MFLKLFLLLSIAKAIPPQTSSGQTIGNLNGVLKASSGAVSGSATTSDLTEGSNLYYTNARAIAAISASSPLTYSSGTVGCQTASSSQAGCLSSANWSTFNSKLSAVGFTVSTPSRTLDSNFTPSSTKPVQVCYTIKISCTITIMSGSCTGSVELRSDTNATPTTIRATAAHNISATGLGFTSETETPICYIVPVNHNVRLVSAGTATISITQQSEVTIDPN